MASNINLKDLIDQLMGMAKESIEYRRKKDEKPSWYGGNKDEEDYWKAMRERNTQTELQKLQNEGQRRYAPSERAPAERAADRSPARKELATKDNSSVELLKEYMKANIGATPDDLKAAKKTFDEMTQQATPDVSAYDDDAEATFNKKMVGMDDATFKRTVNDRNVPLRGAGFIEVDGKQTRVIGNEVYDPRGQSPTSEAPVGRPGNNDPGLDRAFKTFRDRFVSGPKVSPFTPPPVEQLSPMQIALDNRRKKKESATGSTAFADITRALTPVRIEDKYPQWFRE
jgi:hypothetical protein